MPGIIPAMGIMAVKLVALPGIPLLDLTAGEHMNLTDKMI